MSRSLSIFWTFLLVLASGSAFSQTPHRIGQVLVRGNNIAANVSPFAKITVCVVNTGCNTAANVYADPGLTVLLSQPLTADASGNYDYYIASGCVDEQISAPGKGMYPLSNVCPFSGIAGPPYTLPTSSTSTLGGVKIDGASITISGAGVISATGGAGNPGGTNLQMQYNNSGTSFGGSGTVVDVAVDPTHGSIRTPLLSTVNNITTPNSVTVNGPSNPVVNYYVNPPGSIFPNQVPHGTFYTADRMLSINDFFGTTVNRLELWNTCRYFLSNTGNMFCGPNTSDVYRNIITHSPSQIGGVTNSFILQNSGGDTVDRSLFMLAKRSTTGFDEGLEPNRVNAGFNFAQPNGTLTKGATDSFGHTIITMAGDGNSRDSLGVGEMLIDLTKVFSPAGNVNFVADPTDATGIFTTVTVDSTLKAAMDAKFGTNYHSVTVVGGSDMQKYNGSCPSTSIGIWTNPDGSQINPYNFAPDDTNHTPAVCITVSGDISSLTDGTGIGIWSMNPNAEYTHVTQKVDSTHIIVPLNFPHLAGEIITWGAGLGYGLSSPNYTPAGTITTGVYISREDIYLAFPMMGWDSANSKIYVYTNSDTAGGEMKLPIYGARTPALSASYTATVSGGVVTAVTTVTPGNYGVSSGIPGVNASGTILRFPPPSVTLGGSGTCTVAPTFSFSTSGQSGYAIALVTGGSGCPSDLTITPQATYANPIKIYPMTIIANVQDPVTHTATGWMKTQALLSSEWATGDRGTQVTLPDQYATDNVQQAYSPFAANSRRFGAQRKNIVYYPQNSPNNSGGIVQANWNGTATSYYFGDASTGFNQSTDPTKWLWAHGAGPAMEAIDGVYGEGIRFSVPPYAGLGSSSDGTLFTIYCATQLGTNFGGYPCDRTVNQIAPRPFIFQDFSSREQAPYMRSDGHLGTVDIGPKITEQGKNVCKQDGTDCPVVVGYSINSYTGPMTPANDALYYFGDSLTISSNSALGTVVSKDCRIKRIDFAETYVSGAVPSSETVDFFISINGVSYTSGAFSWGGSGRNTLVRTDSPGVLVHAGDVITSSFHTPAPWTTPPGVISFTESIFCALP